MDGRICTAAPLALANQLPLPRLSKSAVLGLPCKRRSIRTRPLPLPANQPKLTVRISLTGTLDIIRYPPGCLYSFSRCHHINNITYSDFAARGEHFSCWLIDWQYVIDCVNGMKQQQWMNQALQDANFTFYIFQFCSKRFKNPFTMIYSCYKPLHKTSASVND